MNYISHFYFFSKEDPYYNCGLIFPDWLAAYKRLKLHTPIKAITNNEKQLNSGIQNHFLGDKIFHGSDYFKEQTHGIKLILEQSSLDKDKFRFSFLAHLLLEMMIDRILLKRDPKLGSTFYEQLDACDDDLLLYFAQENSAVDEGFKILIQKFKQYRFILNYIESDKFVYSLTRITSRVGIVFDDNQSREIIELIGMIEEYVNRNLEQLFLLFRSHEK